MKEYDDYSAKEEKQLAVCQHLITEEGYLSQGEIHHGLQNHSLDSINRSTVSQLLKLLGIIKIRSTKRQKIYSVNPQLLPAPDTGRSVAEMVLSVEHSGEFILIHTVARYGRTVAQILNFRALLETFGMIAGNNIVWVTPRVVKRTALVHRQISCLLKLNIYS